jgi:hypothetical protein
MISLTFTLNAACRDQRLGGSLLLPAGAHPGGLRRGSAIRPSGPAARGSGCCSAWRSAWPSFPYCPACRPLDPASGSGLLILAQQLLVGFAMGFAIRLVFSAVDMAGNLISLQMGLGFATFI